MLPLLNAGTADPGAGRAWAHAVLLWFPSALPGSHGAVVTALWSSSVTLQGKLFLEHILGRSSMSPCSALIKEHFLVPFPEGMCSGGAGGMGVP